MLKWRDIAGIFLLAFLWIPTFLIVRIGVQEMPPIFLTFLRCAAGGLFLLAFIKARGGKILPFLRDWKVLIFGAILVNVIPFTFCSVGEIYVDSSTAGIIEGTVPMFTVLFAYLWIRERPIYKGQIWGIILGFIGLVIIFLPTMLQEIPGSGMGVFYLILMSLFFGMGFVYTEKNFSHLPSIETAALILIISSFILFPSSLMFESTFSSWIPSWKMITMIVGLGIFGTAISWVTFFFLIKRIGASYVAIASLLCPVFCLALGTIFLAENLTWYKLLGVSIILMSVFLMEKTLVAHVSSFLRKILFIKKRKEAGE